MEIRPIKGRIYGLTLIAQEIILGTLDGITRNA